MDIVDVMIVPTPKHIERITIHHSRMSPPSLRNLAFGIDFHTIHHPWRVKIWKIKKVDLIQVDVLTVTASESYNLCLLYGVGRVKSFWLETILSLNIWFGPSEVLETKAP